MNRQCILPKIREYITTLDGGYSKNIDVQKFIVPAALEDSGLYGAALLKD